MPKNHTVRGSGPELSEFIIWLRKFLGEKMFALRSASLLNFSYLLHITYIFHRQSNILPTAIRNCTAV